MIIISLVLFKLPIRTGSNNNRFKLVEDWERFGNRLRSGS